ncbi:class A beta-lactamase-related serine hydrolase [Segetibacter sp. 3557_3]|uniref:serine hydrolase domain-containing protein n=1 Tax=Segetibacter sp. 3557_3 TaxID=2547429 RepID=UPI0010586318|nr:serine hydrolase domain-containing protein [Segetibacter sp. 3557_3]TDH27431.1 class A beta-lactamase-related serine hydrolase [Segetibacter sp. 3557_3]
MNYFIYILILLSFVGCNQKSTTPVPQLQAKDTSFFRKLSPAERAFYKEALYKSYDSLYGRGNFNGSIIIAKNGEILLEEYKGYSDFSTKDTITPNTAFHIASVSKTFTGMAVLKLWEEGKLSLEDSLTRYFPEFPYKGITIRMLLNHRSGLPNYVYFMPEDTAFRKRGRIATNDDMLQVMIRNKPGINNYPDRSFHYCNTNFALLALIVEYVTAQPFPEYMRSNLFVPLGMKDTYVFSIADTGSYKPSYLYPARAIGIENWDCIYGDKNVYSTPRDLLLWDMALYTNRYVNKGTLEEALVPYSNERPSVHNYGLGWRLMMLPDNKIVYHNGWWHGNNAVFTRVIKDTATIIITGNRYNPGIYRGMHLGDIFNRHPGTELPVIVPGTPQKQEG